MLLAPQSGAHRIAPHRDPTQSHTQTHDVIYFWKKSFKDLKNNVPKCLTSKYTNTVLVKFADRPNKCYIFENAMIREPQKQCSQVSDIQIHKYSLDQIDIFLFLLQPLRWKVQSQFNLTTKTQALYVDH